ncbi:MAG: Chaperone protein DnaJ [candidate division WS6 bacterium OLB20]|uniref:Chaperone protein DnaJ n=1 Tax=candidate division WS6 bacterium OLB20 TaxID=1617426 RepID=A0A136M0Z8_9BACT|nr:MAG: Chaperone protein DnaJ [candidate division WS6 bacterium OLB20]
MDSANPFVQLGLPQNASVAEVRAAFRKLAKQKHPDKRGSDREFIDTVNAYRRAVELAAEPVTVNRPVKEAPKQNHSHAQRRRDNNFNAVVDFRTFLIALGSQLALLLLARIIS